MPRYRDYDSAHYLYCSNPDRPPRPLYEITISDYSMGSQCAAWIIRYVANYNIGMARQFIRSLDLAPQSIKVRPFNGEEHDQAWFESVGFTVTDFTVLDTTLFTPYYFPHQPSLTNPI